MNGLAVMLCVSLLGVQQTWRTTQEGQLEYVLQVEPTFLASLEQGESITSNLPAKAKEVHRLCLRFSAGDLKKAPQRTLELPPLATAEERAAKSEPDIPVALVVDAQGRSEETTDVSHGWQAASDGRVKYLVQLTPDLLGKLREGDEIHMNLYPEAAKIQQFIVLAGQNVLPRKLARPHATLTAKDHKTIAPAAAENPAVYGPVARASEPTRLRNPPRYAVADETTEPPAEPALAEQPQYGPAAENPPAAPELFAANQPEEPAQEEQPLYGPEIPNPARAAHPRLPATEAPVFDKSQFDQSQFANAPVNKPKTHIMAPKTTHASLTPSEDGNHYLPESDPRHTKPRSSFGAKDDYIATTSAEEDRADLDDNRTASAEPTKRRSSLSAGTTKSAKEGSTSERDAVEPASWGAWMFVCCALFISIGGNLYLGWTAAEFYSRYRLAIDRMRGSSRETVDD